MKSGVAALQTSGLELATKLGKKLDMQHLAQIILVDNLTTRAFN